ncbi:hypothetical protein CYMTET_51862 [Cymbomonas tetramitiformis]|uniref:CCHC-type domain-containing protein n=1 Tax=Cymbomonas tetramitiformis TaxID=36881 RepID=A0AAE0BLG8_9CHLO|nr:hypothetical protein CYMTET_51862 [Cymbomonas tetramitiformis]
MQSWGYGFKTHWSDADWCSGINRPVFRLGDDTGAKGHLCAAFNELCVCLRYCRMAPPCAGRLPPPSYKCKKCGVAASHYLNECPMNICHRCKMMGHIATHCPLNTFSCRRCGVSGHLASHCRRTAPAAAERIADDEDAASMRTWSSAASDAASSEMSIDPQEHCVERQGERRVSDREIQRTVRDGTPELDPQGDPRRVKRTFGGVTVITEGRRIITTWREAVNSHNQPEMPRQRVRARSTIEDSVRTRLPVIQEVALNNHIAYLYGRRDYILDQVDDEDYPSRLPPGISQEEYLDLFYDFGSSQFCP